MDEMEKEYDGKSEQIVQIPVDELHEFRGHTFQVRDDEEMKSLMESVKESGFITPLMAFRNEDGEPELISGHRRLKVAKKLGITTVPVVMKRVDRDNATVLMGMSNFLYRSKMLPSEKAFTYKAMLLALRKKGSQFGGDREKDERTRDYLSKQIGISSSQIYRFIRITELITELLFLVDHGKMRMRVAIEISYLNREAQECIFEVYQEDGILPSSVLVREMRGLQDKGKLTADKIRELLAEQEDFKQVEKYKLVFHNRIICQLLEDCPSITQREERIIRGLYLVAKKDKEKEERYQEEQRQKWEAAERIRLSRGGGDTYGG